MTNSEYAAKMGITLEKLREESMAFLQCEGYAADGKEYETLDEWIKRKPAKITREPYDGGRGFGTYGKEE